MIRQCFLANTGIRFHTSLLPNVGLDPASLYPTVQPRPPALYTTDIVEQTEYDALHAPPAPAPASSAQDSTRPPSMHDRSDSVATLVNGTPPTSFKPFNPLTPSTSPSSSPPQPQKTTLARLLDKKAAPGTLTEEEEDLADALCPLYDQLQLALGWWMLEVIPLTQHTQDPLTNKWVPDTYANWGRGREVPIPPPSALAGRTHGRVAMHRTVDVREQAGTLVRWVDRKERAYKPKAKWRDEMEVEYVA
jgi:hypothetical protein